MLVLVGKPFTPASWGKDVIRVQDVSDNLLCMPHLIVYDQRITALTLRWLRVFDYFSDQHTPSTMSSSPKSIWMSNVFRLELVYQCSCAAQWMTQSWWIRGWSDCINQVDRWQLSAGQIPSVCDCNFQWRGWCLNNTSWGDCCHVVSNPNFFTFYIPSFNYKQLVPGMLVWATNYYDLQLHKMLIRCERRP